MDLSKCSDLKSQLLALKAACNLDFDWDCGYCSAIDKVMELLGYGD